MIKKQKRILIIDDEAVFRKAISEALTSCGYQCVAEEDPADGIMRLKKEAFNLVLLDIMMDPYDGWDTLTQIRGLRNGVETPVIMSSAKKLLPDEIIRYSEFVAGFFEKPFYGPDLCNAVSEFFRFYDGLITNVSAAELQGISPDISKKWIRINSQIHAINQMLEVVSPFCIPDLTSTEEKCFAERMEQINQIMNLGMQERDQLKILYPVFSTSV